MHVLEHKTIDYAMNKWTGKKLIDWKLKLSKSLMIKKFQMWGNDPHCHYCREYVRPDKTSVDHIICQSHFGSNHPNNLLLSCDSCNRLRGDIPYEVFVNIVTSKEDRLNFIDFKIQNKNVKKTIKVRNSKECGIPLIKNNPKLADLTRECSLYGKRIYNLDCDIKNAKIIHGRNHKITKELAVARLLASDKLEELKRELKKLRSQISNNSKE